MHRRTVCTIAAIFASLGAVRAQDPGFGYATDTNNQIVSVGLANGQASAYSGTTLFAANALGYDPTNGAEGSVIYSSSATTGPVAAWNRATNTHTLLGNITSTTSGYTNPYPTGSSIADAAYWNGAAGIPAGYYIVSGSRGIYRVDLNNDGTAAANLTSIQNVTLVATIPNTLSNSFSFGDIAFSPTGVLYLSDSTDGLSIYNFASNTISRVGAASPLVYPGQIAFGLDGNLYGVGNSAGTASSQGNDLYRINTATGALTLIAANTDPGYTYKDFSGAAQISIVPEPAAFAFFGLAGVCWATATLRRRWLTNARVSAVGTC